MRAWSVQDHAHGSFPRCFNVLPGSTVPVLRGDTSKALVLINARWGYTPPWWKQAKPPDQFFSVRYEDVANKPMWQSAYRSVRCLIPADGWFQWSGAERVAAETGKVDDNRQPYFLFRKEGPVCFAGLTSLWKSSGRLPLITCAVVTRDASLDIAGVERRIPVVLPDEAFADWLDSGRRTEAALDTVIARSISGFSHYPVSKRLNSSMENDEALVKPTPS